MRCSNPKLGNVAKLIGNDVSPTAAALQIVNSPLVSFVSQVTLVQQAVMLLGLLQVVSVVRAVILKSKLTP